MSPAPCEQSPAPCGQANYMQEATASTMLPGMVMEFGFLLRTDFRRKGEKNSCNFFVEPGYFQPGLRNG